MLQNCDTCDVIFATDFETTTCDDCRKREKPEYDGRAYYNGPADYAMPVEGAWN